MYRTVEDCFWSDPKIKSLQPDGKLLALYLFTNGHSHVSGIYYMPPVLAALETGIQIRRLNILLDTLSRAGFCKVDSETETVWIVKMFGRQGRGEKHERAAAKHLESLHNSLLIKDFLGAYPTVERFCSDTLLDRVSRGYLPPRVRESEKSETKTGEEGSSLRSELRERNGEPDEVFSHWQSLEALISHKAFYKGAREAVNQRISDGYTLDDIRRAVSRYAQLVQSGCAPGHNQWTLEELMRGGKGKKPGDGSWLDRMLDPHYCGIGAKLSQTERVVQEVMAEMEEDT